MMKSRDRIRALLQSEPLDRLPRTLWRHFPIDDETSTGLSDTTVAFQEMFDWDLVKVCFNSQYAAEDWGNDIRWPQQRTVWSQVRSHCIKAAADWEQLQPLPVDRGAWGREVDTIARISQRLCDVPVTATVFSPLYQAQVLAGDAVFEHLRDHPRRLHQALDVIADTTARFTRSVLRSGAAGIFFAVSLARTDWLSKTEYEEFGRPYDLKVLAAAEAAFFNILHLHGEDLMFQELMDYPTHAVNWYDRGGGVPTLLEAYPLSDKILMGGIKHRGLEELSRQNILADVEAMKEHLPPDRFFWASGCDVPLAVTYERIWWLREALTPQKPR